MLWPTSPLYRGANVRFQKNREDGKTKVTDRDEAGGGDFEMA